MKTLQQIVDQLNRATKCDPLAITQLINHRVDINSALMAADDVDYLVDGRKAAHTLGLLGILNGMRSEDDPLIVAVFAATAPYVVAKFELLAVTDYQSRGRAFGFEQTGAVASVATPCCGGGACNTDKAAPAAE